MKIVKEVLYEKFVEDSDPIHDMGIRAKTRYRSVKKQDWNYYFLQYLEQKKNIFGKPVERWRFVPRAVGPANNKKFIFSMKDSDANYKYVAGNFSSSFNDFIQKWPYIEDYLKDVEKDEKRYYEEYYRQAKEEKRKRKEGDIEYLT